MSVRPVSRIARWRCAAGPSRVARHGLSSPISGPLLAFIAAALVLTITPGPDMTLFLGRTLSAGRSAGMAAMLGAATGILVHTTLAAFGLSALIAASPEAFAV